MVLREPDKGEVLRTPLPRYWVNRGKNKGRDPVGPRPWQKLSAASLVPLVQPQGAERGMWCVHAGDSQAAGGVPAARPGVHGVVRGDGLRRSSPTEEKRGGG